MPTKQTNVADLIEGTKPWVSEVTLLREIALSTGLEEGIKWGIPVYMVNGKNVMGIGAFKSYVGIWFYQGVFLSDPKQVLLNAQEGKTKALRQWRFTSKEDINPSLVKKYIKEAIKLTKEGKELKPKLKKAVPFPAELLDAFKKEKQLKISFGKLTPGKQREYLEYIAEAKAEATRLRRVEKSKPLILAEMGLHDKYK